MLKNTSKAKTTILVLTFAIWSVAMHTFADEKPKRIEATVAEMHAFKVVHHAEYLKKAVKEAGGTNKLSHTTELANEGNFAVVTPALDHIYSKAVIDLSKAPVVLEVPKVEKDRYFSIMVTDQEHYVNYDMIRPVGTYIFIKEGWKGNIPAGATVIENRSTYPHLFLRTQVKTPDDLKNALAIQSKIKLTGKVGKFDFTDPVQFTIDTHNVHTKNAGLLASLAGKYTAEDHERMQKFMTQEYIKRSAAEGANNIGCFGPIDSKEPRSDDPIQRLIGIVGHLGLPVESATMKGKTHAYYTGVVTNCDGEILNGSKPEVFTFPYEPGVDEFWSITRYHGVTYNTIPGAQDVYNAYNTKPDANGNITITFSAKDPMDGTYWMPVIEGEPYYFIERFYGPRMDEITTVLERCDPKVKVTRENFTIAESNKMMFGIQQQAGGVNKTVSIPRLASVDFQPVVRMNQDTLYHGTVVNVSKGATVTIPEMDGRYVSLQVHDERHFVPMFEYGPGTYELKAETDYVMVVVRIQADETDPEDVHKAAEWQSQIVIKSNSDVPLKWGNWDIVSLDAVRADLNAELHQYSALETMGDGTPESVNVEAHRAITAGGYLAAPAKDAMYVTSAGNGSNECTAVTYMVPTVVGTGFWSITMYNADGYIFNDKASVNNRSVVYNEDGTFTMHYGNNCPADAVNVLNTVDGWNIMMRIYRPTDDIVKNGFELPEIKQ